MSEATLATGRVRLCIWYVAGYLVLSGLALLIAPQAALAAMLSNADYGVVMPRWVGMLSVAMGTLIVQVVRQRVVALYPLSFFMPAAMLIGFIGMYLQSETRCSWQLQRSWESVWWLRA